MIVGGGSAGWMAAATLIKCFPKKSITLVESPNIPTVGVGESTIGGIRNWLKLLDIEDKDFFSFTDASYKLSIKFTDFYKKGESFHYPFGLPNLDGNQADLNDWWFKKILNPKTPYSDYADCLYPQMAYINQHKFSKNENYDIPYNFKLDSAVHFDATKFALWLRDHYCIPKGVKHIKEDVNTIEQDEKGIVSLNKKYKADLFVDCTGFKSLLLGQTLKEEFISYSNLLPNNSAWATKIPYKNKKKELVAYTNCTAYNNGWIWNIPLWSRIGTGYVYSDKFIDDDNALKEFQKYLGRKDLEFKKIKMRVGIHKRLWVKNVVAVGLSSGFIEPLESNGLFTVHQFLIHLVRNLQRDNISQLDRDTYTYGCRTEFDAMAEFVALHYALSHRDDTEYWRSNLNKQWSETLIDRKPVLIKGIDKAIDNRTFNYHHNFEGGLHCIAAGMHWAPTDVHTIKSLNVNLEQYHLDDERKRAINHLDNKKRLWNDAIKNSPTLYDYLLDNYYK